MDTSIYIGSNKIQMACGSVKSGIITLDAFETAELDTEAIINGKVIDQGAFERGMSRLITASPGANLEKVRITIGSSPAFERVRKVPRLKEAKMMQWLQGEFAELNDPEDPLVYDYMLLSSEGADGDTAFLCAMSRTAIEDIISLFDDLDITISCIDVALSSQIKFVHNMKLTENRNFLVLYLDGQNLDASLYVNGIFTVSNRTRLLSQRGTEELMQEVDGVISKLIQFNRGENNGSIEFVYLAGFSEEQALVNERNRSGYPAELRNISVDGAEMTVTKDGGFVLGDYLCAVGNLFKE